ncbi:hypothetical protein A3A05_00720 [Candidatus Nomurabacteria bacterium RIFCSPLOWO2_01_FULL_41_12]|uniref:Uncharacterized protein n=1 Tax=Candidatus Nomurabacteria bacterium RIFCSPLOWO2_01_FULL_41_12 TaxID=1801774 RepID=A0A1F6WVH1_9BACT|nr:MAG: hypothetical protein A3A05_00720 [Candidatus Nomurabacteria bacterium RIFCSPLOWO2_01_FULL_41_12]
MKISRILFFIVGLSIVAQMSYIAFAADQMKTTEIVIADSAVAISTNQTYPFTLYIGDNLTGVTAPLKSLQFIASGVYTGNGTIAFMIDGDAATTKTFTLPDVGTTPTYFKIDYKDTTDKINPTSAGSYDYSLNFNPSGVTVYGLGIRMSETHRYKPPTCGGMPIYGDLTSAVFDSTATGNGAGYNSVLWKGTLGTGGTGKVRFQFAASTASAGPWNYYGGATCGALDYFEAAPDTPIELKGTSCFSAWNNKRYFRYKIRICSDDCVAAGTYTPTVDDVIVSWSP